MFINDSSPKSEFLLEYCRNIVQLNHTIWRRNNCMVFSLNIQNQWTEAKILRPLVFPVGFFDGSTRLFSRTEGSVSIFFAYGYNLMTFKKLFSVIFSPVWFLKLLFRGTFRSVFNRQPRPTVLVLRSLKVRALSTVCQNKIQNEK